MIAKYLLLKTILFIEVVLKVIKLHSQLPPEPVIYNVFSMLLSHRVFLW